MVSYKEIMKSALIKKPIRALSSTFSTFRHSPTASLPFKLKFESSAICNLKCRMCPHSTGLKRKKGFLKFKDFKYVFSQINPVYLNLTGIGEPFLNPDIFKIIKYAKSRSTMVKFDTNATLLNRENIQKILDSGIDIISMSIDGADKKSYESIRVGSNFELIKHNIKNLVSERNRLNSSTKIHMFFVLQEKNIFSLPKFILLAEELGVDYLAGSFVVTLGKNKNMQNKIKPKANSARISGLIKQTEALVRNSKIEVSISPLLEYLKSSKGEYYNKSKPCFMPWYSAFITWDGEVNPCDFSCDNEVVFGNAFKEPFGKIWNNEKLRKFRMQLLNNRQSIPICKSCGVDETYILNEIDKIKKIPFLKYFQHNKNNEK